MRRGRLVAGAAIAVCSVIATRLLSVPVAPQPRAASAPQVVPLAAPAPIAASSRGLAVPRAQHGVDPERFIAFALRKRKAVTERLDIGEPERCRDPDLGRLGTLRTTVSSRRSNRLAFGGNAEVINPVYDGLQAEAAIAMNTAGTVLVAGFNDASGFATTPYNVSGVARSLDGGITWTTSGPLPTGGYSLNGDPDVKYDPVGDRFFYSSVARADGKTVVCVHRSDAQGDKWEGPFVIPSSDAAGKFSDKEMIAVHPITGRLIAAWVDVSGNSIRVSYSDDGGTTWSAEPPIAQSVQMALHSPQVRFVPAPANETSKVWVVYMQIAPSGGASLQWVRSDDGGDTWGAPQLLRAEVPKPDEVLGLGRASMIPAIDVDPEYARLYVVNAVPDASGTTDIEFFAGVDSASFSAPVLINSNPGADGAQFRPTVAVDPITHRIHVTWYDQPGDLTGDLTELMRTFSDDFGATWSPPTPVFDRPFRASYGDPGGGPNLGDYNECVAGGGVLHAVAAATVDKPRFDDGQPSASMGVIETYHARLDDGPVEVALRIAAVAVSDACSPPGSARLDVGEAGSLHFTLFHYVANPLCGATMYTGVAAALFSPTPGVTLTDAQQWYGTVGPLGLATNPAPFHIQLDPGFVPGTDIDLLLEVTTDQGAALLRWRLPTGSPGATVTLIDEDFEGVSMPSLPAGWSNISEYPYGTAWKTAGSTAGVGAGSPAAFHGDEMGALDHLFSPSVAVPAAPPGAESWVTLEFDLAYSLVNAPPRLVEASNFCRLLVHDLTGGLWTERSLGVEAFAEEFTTGARQGYDHRYPGPDPPQLNAWSGGSQGVQHVRIRIPGAGITGHTIQLRFDFYDAELNTCESVGLPDPCGVSIDNVVLQHVLATSSPCPVVGVPSADPVAFGLRGLTPNPSPSRRLEVRFTLADKGEARLEVFDLTGRVVRAMDVGGFGPGEHSIDLVAHGQVAPGIYYVRLRQAGREAVSRAVVLR